MGIILSKTTYASQAVQLTTLFIAVHCSKLGKPYRKVAVGARGAFVNFAVVRTVHRLQQILFTLFRGVDRLKAVLTIFSIMSAGYIQFLITNMWCNYRLVASGALCFFQELFQTLTQFSTLRQPKWKPLTYFL